jgi:hypothetical protein
MCFLQFLQHDMLVECLRIISHVAENVSSLVTSCFTGLDIYRSKARLFSQTSALSGCVEETRRCRSNFLNA